ncbi:D-xylose transport system permease protein [Hamadaea flava]|uniref:Xylose transport system permease protein XylH n=1 Tax=Hamadaea flava TaxID=1742688 RepID=A0ABV8LRS4_9ACTN|nr:sugar ABC transporter permease [Hamadaea flava]MCP2327268.1 D-xylose transport system permease protein [Hamadaea flava]
MTNPTIPPPAAGPLADSDTHSPWELIKRRIRGGELGAWPVLIGLIIIWVVFQALNDRFLTAQNLSNLALQITAVGMISVGIVLVLLLGEIDLSVGSVAGVCAAALAVLSVRRGWSDISAIIVALLLGALIGFLQGTIFAKLGVPAFVVTLAGNLGWLGLQLYLLGSEGTINVPTGTITDLMNTKLSQAAGWIVGVIVVALYAFAAFTARARRASAGLPAASLRSDLVRVIGLAAIVVVTVVVLNSWQGVPLGLLILVGLVAVLDLVLRKTRYGRSIFAVGGNIEAARRAGINVAAVQISVFTLCSTFAALGGILLVSRGFSATQTTGASDVLLLAIAGAVIGGVSLFGGRGSPWGALLGAVVLGSISSGMLLIDVDSSVRYMITAAVLLAAVILDSVSRRGRRASGRG